MKAKGAGESERSLVRAQGLSVGNFTVGLTLVYVPEQVSWRGADWKPQLLYSPGDPPQICSTFTHKDTFYSWNSVKLLHLRNIHFIPSSVCQQLYPPCIKHLGVTQASTCSDSEMISLSTWHLAPRPREKHDDDFIHNLHRHALWRLHEQLSNILTPPPQKKPTTKCSVLTMRRRRRKCGRRQTWTRLIHSWQMWKTCISGIFTLNLESGTFFI